MSSMELFTQPSRVGKTLVEYSRVDIAEMIKKSKVKGDFFGMRVSENKKEEKE